MNCPADRSYKVRTARVYTASVGGLVNLGRQFDLMLDGNASLSGDEKCARSSAMLRFKRRLALGSAVTLVNQEEPVVEIQGGYTSTPFKWLSSVAFTPAGVVIETGVVVRFGVQRWKVVRPDQPCSVLPVPEAPRTEFSPHD